MTSRKHSDPRPLFAIVAALVAFSISSAISNLETGAVLDLAERFAPIALGALAIASALAPQRFLATRRTLRSRRLRPVVPADEFDPETRRRSLLRRPARASRAQHRRLDRSPGKRPAGAAHLRSRAPPCLPDRSPGRAARAAAGGASQPTKASSCDLPRKCWSPAGTTSGEEAVTLRTELVLARPSIEPLARPDVDPDPLQPFAAAMAALRSERGRRRPSVSTCCRLPAGAARRLRRRLSRQARRRHREGPRWGELLGAEHAAADRARARRAGRAAPRRTGPRREAPRFGAAV